MILKNERNYPPFSVVMCVYGGDNSKWFRIAAESIINQTVKPKEIVLVVDGPIPNELDKVILELDSDDLFTVIRLKENVGHGNARRTGLENCKYNIVAIMDSDDISVKNRFEKQLELFIKNPELSIVGGNIEEFIGSIGNVIGKRIVPTGDKAIKEYIKKRCPFNQMTVMFKKDEVEKVGGYIDWYCNEDYYLWIRMHLANMKFANVDDILVYARVGEDMYKRRGGWKYFCSELKLQKFMKSNKIINLYTFCLNVAKRFVVQLVLTNKARGIVFKMFARE